MQAIRTRYLPATNTLGARIQAKCEAQTVVIPLDYSLSTEGNHLAACQYLHDLLTWAHSPMVGGVFAGDYYWVFTRSSPATPN